jgi:RND family efflux transporter MFP subunit
MKQYFRLAFCLVGILTGTAYAEQFPAVIEAESKAVVAAEREGVLMELHIDVGDRVKKGDLIATVFHKDMLIKKQQYEATRKFLTRMVENLTKLNEKGMATDDEKAKAEMDLAVNLKETEILQNMIDRSQVRAPFSGVIVNRQIQPHEWIRAGQPVSEMYDPDKLRIVADIPAEIAVGLKSGRTDTFYFPDVKQDVKAKFKLSFPQVDVRSNTVKIYWVVEPAERKKAHLVPGMKGVLKLGSD